MTQLRTLEHRNGTTQRIYADRVETDIPGHATLYAMPRSDQVQTALALGYAEDIVSLTQDHDPLHAILADWIGLPVSFALLSAAGGLVDPVVAEAEEAVVMALQRFLRLIGMRVS